MSDRANNLQAFGRAVREARERIGMSQEHLAESCGLHRTYIGSVERGERNPTLISMLRIAYALGVRLSSLIENCQFEAGDDDGRRK